MKKCPKCQQTKKVHRSHRDAPIWLQLVGWHRFRCTQCNLYFEGFRLFPNQRNGSNSSKDLEEPQVQAEPKPVVKPEVETVRNTVPDAAADSDGATSRGQTKCVHCQSHRIRRAKREGILEEYIYPIFSKYPFKCSDCGTRFLKKGRS